MGSPLRVFAVAGMAIGIAVLAMAQCGPAPKPGNPAFAVTTVATVEQPIAMAVRAGDDALYIAEWRGRVLALRGGAVDPTPVLDMSNLTVAEGERGLLGIAFSPDGSRLYVNYTDRNGNTNVDEHTLGTDGRAVAGSRRQILFQQQPFPNHNGGQLAFGPDGYLYVGLGDGGSGGDPQGNGQDTNTWLGKILRIDPSAPANGKAYTIPSDNPFVGGGGLPEIWAYGLRNPWRFTFDKTTGDLWIADVGQGKYEEINFSAATQGRDAAKGGNFGWNRFEGNHDFDGGGDHAGFVFPVFEYGHGEGCSVTGGYRYRGTAITGLAGAYLFADYCNSTIRVLSLAADGTASEIASVKADPSPIVSFGQDASGELYVLAFDGTVSKLIPAT